MSSQELHWATRVAESFRKETIPTKHGPVLALVGYHADRLDNRIHVEAPSVDFKDHKTMLAWLKKMKAVGRRHGVDVAHEYGGNEQYATKAWFFKFVANEGEIPRIGVKVDAANIEFIKMLGKRGERTSNS